MVLFSRAWLQRVWEKICVLFIKILTYFNTTLLMGIIPGLLEETDVFLRAPANFGSGHQTAESFLVLLYYVMVVGPTSCITCVLMFREYNASIELEF